VICTLCRHHIPLTNHHLTLNNEAFKILWTSSFRIPSAFISIKRNRAKLIHKLKYKGHEDIGAVLGNWYAADLKNYLTNCKYADSVFAQKKFRERGYNQVTTFGLALSKD
jgi:predicted amidophosphoribosyltransferase